MVQLQQQTPLPPHSWQQHGIALPTGLNQLTGQDGVKTMYLWMTYESLVFYSSDPPFKGNTPTISSKSAHAGNDTIVTVPQQLVGIEQLPDPEKRHPSSLS